MFCDARLMRLLRPIPPTPTPAILSVSLGAVYPRPSTRRGTIAMLAAPAPTFLRKVRRDTPSRLIAMAVPPPMILPDPARRDVRPARVGDTIPRYERRPDRLIETTISRLLFDRRVGVDAAARRAVGAHAGRPRAARDG